MRTVFLVTRHPDVARLGPALERSGLSAPTIPPERLATDEGGPSADVLVLDFRDVPPAAFNLINASLAETSTVVVALVAEDQLDRITGDLPIDDLAVFPSSAAEIARRIERA
ncbi:MAG TPA: hypothetical protein VFK32_10375, partial [Tepidiformaceae bacterium]|nr:hypothetical protein [Tepidiformaceae bacterium]